MKIISGLLMIVLGSAGCSATPELKAVKVTVARVESTVTTTSSGTVEARQQAVLGFGIVGRVGQISVRNGDQVKKGQLLAQVENRDLQTVFQDALQENKRSQLLFSSKLISRAAQDESRRNLEIARSNYDKAVIRAPFDGVVTSMNLEVGEMAQAVVSKEKPAIRLIDLKPRIVKGNIDEVDLSKVHVGALARIKVPAVGQKPFDGEVTGMVPYISTTREQDRTSEVELGFRENDPRIPVGASADIEIVVQGKDDALAVPSRLILGSGENRYVFRFNEGKIHRAMIKTGVGNYDRTEVIQGLSAGDTVVYPPDNVDLRDDLKCKVAVLPWP